MPSSLVPSSRGMSPNENVPRRGQNRHQADEHAEVAHAVDDERLVGRGAGAVPLDVKADQEIRANAHQLPEHEHHRQVAGDANAQHREREQRKVLEEAVEPAAAVQVLAVGERHFMVDHVVQLVVHVADGVDMNARGDQRDHAEHRNGQRVDVVADREFQGAELGQGIPIAGECRRRAVRGVMFTLFFGVLDLHGRQAEGGCSAGDGVRLLFVLLAMVGRSFERMRRQPHAEQRVDADQEAGDDRANGDVAGELLRGIPHAHPEHLRHRIADANDGKRYQRQ